MIFVLYESCITKLIQSHHCHHSILLHAVRGQFPIQLFRFTFKTRLSREKFSDYSKIIAAAAIFTYNHDHYINRLFQAFLFNCIFLACACYKGFRQFYVAFHAYYTNWSSFFLLFGTPIKIPVILIRFDKVFLFFIIIPNTKRSDQAQ